MEEIRDARAFEQPIVLTIDSCQDVDGRVQEVHMESLGRYFECDGMCGVEYDECDTAGIINTTTLTVMGTTVMMVRSGARGIHMTFDRTRACTSLYRTPEGDAMEMQVFPRRIAADMQRSGGSLALSYDLNYAGAYACRHPEVPDLLPGAGNCGRRSGPRDRS